MQPISANQQNEEKKPFGRRQDQQLLLEKAHSRQDRCSWTAKWEPAKFFLSNLRNPAELRTSSLGQRSTPRKVSMTCWILFQSSLSSLSISKYSSVWSFVDQYHRQSITLVWEYDGRMVGDTLSLLPFTFLDSMCTRLRPSSSNTLRALESPTMPLKVMEVDLLRHIMEHLTLCRGKITAVLKTPSKLRKW